MSRSCLPDACRGLSGTQGMASGTLGAFLIASLFSLSTLPAVSFAQEARLDSEGLELGPEQEELAEVVRELTQRMEKLAKTLETKEPEDADRLRSAAQEIRKAGLAGSMKEIQQFLGRRDFLDALTKEEEVLKQLRGVVDLLDARSFEEPATREDIQKLDKKRKELKAIADAQENLLNETRRVRFFLQDQFELVDLDLKISYVFYELL
ncbi:MAG: hypothetical protein AAF517_27780, partial [Planctomycetota bacterium]